MPTRSADPDPREPTLLHYRVQAPPGMNIDPEYLSGISVLDVDARLRRLEYRCIYLGYPSEMWTSIWDVKPIRDVGVDLGLCTHLGYPLGTYLSA